MAIRSYRALVMTLPHDRRTAGAKEGRASYVWIARSLESQMAAGIILSVLGLGGFCFLLFRSVVYALPLFVGFAAALWAFDTGAGPIAAIGASAVIGCATFGIFQLAFGLARSAAARMLVALVFAAPAAFAGYHVVFGLAQYGMSSDVWRHVFAAVGATVIGFTAVARLTDSVRWFSEPGSTSAGQNIRQ
jgi:hypothetical protein